MRITGPDTIEIRAPRRIPQAQIDDFIERHQAWIEKHILYINCRMMSMLFRNIFVKHNMDGIGTTIFSIAGTVLVLGAAAVIFARRKAEQE